MKKRKTKVFIIFLFIIAITFPCLASNELINAQAESLGISSFIKEADKYTENFEGNINAKELLDSAITGKIENQKLFQSLIHVLGKETVSCIQIIASILVIIVIHSILNSISEGLENKGVAQIIYYVQYILIVTIVMANFSEILKMVKDTIQNLTGFMNTLIPILITLMITTGNIASAGFIQPLLLFIMSFISNIIEIIIVPVLLIATALSVISNLSGKIQIDKLSQYFKTSIVWLIGILLTLFVGVLSLEGTLTSSVDGITAKTAKAAVSSVIPVVGKILGDTVDTVIGCANILKNAVGVVGAIIILAICAMPIIKLTVLTCLYKLMAGLCQPIADEKIVKLLEQLGDTFKILLAIVCSISVMLLIGVTIIIKMTNSSLMYR